jgi:hypothetical protein
MSRMSENVGASTSRNPKDLHGLYWDNCYLPYQLSSMQGVPRAGVDAVPKSRTGLPVIRPRNLVTGLTEPALLPREEVTMTEDIT